MEERKFYIVSEGVRKGPFTLSELEEFEINRETLVWHEGLKEWREAGEIEELRNILQSKPPAIPREHQKVTKVDADVHLFREPAFRFDGVLFASEVTKNVKLIAKALVIGILSFFLWAPLISVPNKLMKENWMEYTYECESASTAPTRDQRKCDQRYEKLAHYSKSMRFTNSWYHDNWYRLDRYERAVQLYRWHYHNASHAAEFGFVLSGVTIISLSLLFSLGRYFLIAIKWVQQKSESANDDNN